MADVTATTPSQTATTSTWTVPAGGPYKIKITAKGAQGGTQDGPPGGAGATITGEFIVAPGTVSFYGRSLHCRDIQGENRKTIKAIKN